MLVSNHIRWCIMWNDGILYYMYMIIQCNREKGPVSAAILTFHSHSKIELSLRKSQLVRMTSIFSLQSNLLWTTQKSFTILIMKIEFCIWSYTYQNNHINCYFNCERLSGLWRIFQCYQLQDPKTIGVVLKSATLLSF